MPPTTTMFRCRLVGLPYCFALIALGALLAGCDARPQPTPIERQQPIEQLALSVALSGADVPAAGLLGDRLDGSVDRSALRAVLAALAVPDVRFEVLDDARAPLLLARAAVTQWEPELLTPERIAGNGQSVSGADVLAAGTPRVVLGSPFVARYSPLKPLGLLQVDGLIRSPLQTFGYTRILGVQGPTLGVVSRSAFDPGLFSDAVQLGPGIIESGALAISEREVRLPAYFRTFAVICEEEAVLGLSLVPTHLRHVGERLLDWSSSTGVSCAEAVNFSGDREALFIVVGAAGSLVIGRPQLPKTALLALGPRP
ncbi:MAG: hypothetical protein AAGG11_12770 [Pseudomonadota bacterium]